MVLKRTYKVYTAVVLKRTNWRQVQWFYCCCCFSHLTVEKAEAGRLATDGSPSQIEDTR